jgi:hypothetical protein
MKGMMFTELGEWVERRWSADVLDDIIDACDLPSGGAYTAVGTYDHTEMVALVTALSEQVGTPVPDLVHAFGRDLFGVLATAHPAVLTDADSSFGLLARLEDHIHPEVRKLYPEAEVPRFDARPDGDVLVLDYHSSRPFADLAAGLIEGCAAWFGESIEVHRQPLADGGERFTLHRR